MPRNSAKRSSSIRRTSENHSNDNNDALANPSHEDDLRPSHELKDEVPPEWMEAFIDAPAELNERLYQGAIRPSEIHEADVAQEIERFDAGMRNSSR